MGERFIQARVAFVRRSLLLSTSLSPLLRWPRAPDPTDGRADGRTGGGDLDAAAEIISQYRTPFVTERGVIPSPEPI